MYSFHCLTLCFHWRWGEYTQRVGGCQVGIPVCPLLPAHTREYTRMSVGLKAAPRKASPLLYPLILLIFENVYLYTVLYTTCA